ncbi:MAG: hypothetical protein AUI95_03810 [Crenarchaeota archaeon 13_1_40CM_3_52_4]|nr:MAG: hypothetical protein AUI95_03810 [Crenarchaeota archaeon 13_1_40CM_3_52_4]
METRYPEGFTGFLEFLCDKYRVDRKRVFIEYSSRPPPPIKGGSPGYYDGLLSYREKNGRVEFLITVFKAAQDPLLTLGHEFAHLVEDLRSGNIGKRLGPPDDVRESKLDDQARLDLEQFWMQKKIDRSKLY